MKEWIIQNLDAAAIAGIVSTLASVTLAIIGLVKSQRSKKRYETLVKDIKARLTYTICPHCSTKVYFGEFEWHLPDGSEDNNLNGIPDHEE